MSTQQIPADDTVAAELSATAAGYRGPAERMVFVDGYRAGLLAARRRSEPTNAEYGAMLAMIVNLGMGGAVVGWLLGQLVAWRGESWWQTPMAIALTWALMTAVALRTPLAGWWFRRQLRKPKLHTDVTS